MNNCCNLPEQKQALQQSFLEIPREVPNQETPIEEAPIRIVPKFGRPCILGCRALADAVLAATVLLQASAELAPFWIITQECLQSRLAARRLAKVVPCKKVKAAKR